jgi:peptidoglycan/LPS O-acetylase OafA/YrhL
MIQTKNQLVQVHSKPAFLPSLNGGRAIAMFLVFGGHFLSMQFATYVGKCGIYAACTQRGWSDILLTKVFSFIVPVPMDYYFIISGFVLAWTFRPEQGAGEYYKRRFARVYPIYFVTSLITFLLFVVMFSKLTSWKVILVQLFMLQAWTPNELYSLGLNPVLWTVSAEVFNYMLFPVLMLLLVRSSKRGLWAIAAGCVGLSFFLPWIVNRTFVLTNPPLPQAPLAGFPNIFSYWFTCFCPAPRLLEFVIGMVIAVMLQRGMRVRINVTVALAFSVVSLCLVNWYLPVDIADAAGMIIPMAVLVAALAQSDLSGKVAGLRGMSLFRSPPLLFLGKISYSFYAVHVLFILFTVVQTPVASGAWDQVRLRLWQIHLIGSPLEALPAWGNFLLFFVYLMASVLAAWILYVTVERPAMKWINKRGSNVAQPESLVERAAHSSVLLETAGIEAFDVTASSAVARAERAGQAEQAAHSLAAVPTEAPDNPEPEVERVS